MESSRRLRCDRISDLPDAIIQHIISFLPSTREAIQTTVLSKRWRNQWTRVPVLIFDFNNGMSHQNYLKFIDNTLLLHDCSKIYKFHLPYHWNDRRFAERIAFATRKLVEDLNLNAHADEILPEFLFNNASLVKLTTEFCIFMPEGNVNWGCLSSLEITYCKLPYQALENIVSGSPSLKSLKLICSVTENIVIASKSLKKLLIAPAYTGTSISVFEISCPNLEELSLERMITKTPQLFAQAIENVLSVSSLLESFKLCNCYVLDRLVIASKSLKKLVLKDVGSNSSDIEISCPKLEEMKLIGVLDFNTAKLLNLPALLCATIDIEENSCKSLIIEILQQLQHLKELKISTSFLQTMSTIKVGGQFSPVLNIQCLTLDTPHFVKHHHFGIAHLLRISPMLEELVINVPCTANHSRIRKNYWDSNVVVFDCLVSHLKTIKITGFPEESSRLGHILNLIKFLLKNARVLVKMAVILEDHNGTSQSDLSQMLLSLPKCSQNVIIEVLHTNSKRR